MFQVDNDSAVAIMPAVTSAGTPGYFTDGNPATGQRATVLTAEFMNMVMMELANLVTDSGQALDKSDHGQVSKAVKAMITNLATVTWDNVTGKPVDWSVAGKTTLTGAVTLKSTLAVAGVATLSGSLSVGTTATVTGATTLKSTLAVTGAATLASTLAVSGLATFANGVTMNNGLVVTAGGLSVVGSATLAAMTATSGSFSSTLAVTGAATLSSSLSVATTATVTGAVTLKSTLAVTGAATLSSTLSVAGSVTTGGGFVSTAIDGLRIAYGGYGSFLRNDGSNFYLLLTNSGDANGTYNALRPLTVSLDSGAMVLGHTLTVAGATTLSSTLAVTGAATLSSTLAVTGAATLSSTLSVAGKITAGSLAVTGEATVSSTLAVTGNTTIGGSFSAAGTVAAGGGSAYLQGDGNVYGAVWGGYLSTYIANLASAAAIAAANAAAGWGGIGTYGLFILAAGTGSGNVSQSPGTLYAGSKLLASNTAASGNGGTVGGTWRLMGYLYNGDGASPDSTSLFQRVA